MSEEENNGGSSPFKLAFDYELGRSGSFPYSGIDPGFYMLGGVTKELGNILDDVNKTLASSPSAPSSGIAGPPEVKYYEAGCKPQGFTNHYGRNGRFEDGIFVEYREKPRATSSWTPPKEEKPSLKTSLKKKNDRYQLIGNDIYFNDKLYEREFDELSYEQQREKAKALLIGARRSLIYIDQHFDSWTPHYGVSLFGTDEFKTVVSDVAIDLNDENSQSHVAIAREDIVAMIKVEGFTPTFKQKMQVIDKCMEGYPSASKSEKELMVKEFVRRVKEFNNLEDFRYTASDDEFLCTLYAEAQKKHCRRIVFSPQQVRRVEYLSDLEVRDPELFKLTCEQKASTYTDTAPRGVYEICPAEQKETRPKENTANEPIELKGISSSSDWEMSYRKYAAKKIIRAAEQFYPNRPFSIKSGCNIEMELWREAEWKRLTISNFKPLQEERPGYLEMMESFEEDSRFNRKYSHFLKNGNLPAYDISSRWTGFRTGFAGDVLVWNGKDYQKISTVQKDQTICLWNRDKEELVDGLVKDVVINFPETIYEICYNHPNFKQPLRVAAAQPLWTDNGWKTADNLTISSNPKKPTKIDTFDTQIKDKPYSAKITAIIDTGNVEPVYSLMTENGYPFFANGLYATESPPHIPVKKQIVKWVAERASNFLSAHAKKRASPQNG